MFVTKPILFSIRTIHQSGQPIGLIWSTSLNLVE
jgi:hypothetical protein